MRVTRFQHYTGTNMLSKHIRIQRDVIISEPVKTYTQSPLVVEVQLAARITDDERIAVGSAAKAIDLPK